MTTNCKCGEGCEQYSCFVGENCQCCIDTYGDERQTCDCNDCRRKRFEADKKADIQNEKSVIINFIADVSTAQAQLEELRSAPGDGVALPSSVDAREAD